MTDYEIGAKIGQALNIASSIALKNTSNFKDYIGKVEELTPLILDKFGGIFSKEKARILKVQKENNSTTKDLYTLKDEIGKLKTLEEFNDYKNKYSNELKNLSKSGKDELKQFIKNHFKLT